MYSRFYKRFFDLLISFTAIIVLSPILLFISLLLYIANDGSPLFIQLRPGKNGRIFKIIKFKTMNENKDIHGNLLQDIDRLTPLGKFIRKTSLDEFPQLINVLKGDMSLIGPRPLLVEYLSQYTYFQNRRHEVRPGITGWAQINGRNTMVFSKRFEFDVWYVDHLTFMLDFKILLATIKNVLFREGVLNGQNLRDVDDLNFNKIDNDKTK